MLDFVGPFHTLTTTQPLWQHLQQHKPQHRYKTTTTRQWWHWNTAQVDKVSLCDFKEMLVKDGEYLAWDGEPELYFSLYGSEFVV